MTKTGASFEVPQPIINDAFEEPTQHWLIRRGEAPVLRPGRRPARYYWRPRAPGPGEAGGVPIEIELANRLRREVARWRAEGYPGATDVTRALLDYWVRPERDRKIIFAQREAAETIIFLREATPVFKQGLTIPKEDLPPGKEKQGYEGFERLAVKMATGSGKTTVMGLLAAWSILNKVHPQSKDSASRYSDTILVLCPNVTIRDRLAELEPQRGSGSIYSARDIVPPAYLPSLAKGLVVVRNWHVLAPHAGNDVGGVTAAVVNKGPESDAAVIDRVLGASGRGRRNVLVFNDEAHHAYRIPSTDEPEQSKLDEADEVEEDERREATVWIEGIDKLQKTRGVSFVVDLSATPVIRHGRDAGKLFPWVVSDFGLVDAIECGLVKIPQLPIADPTGKEIPEFFNIWDWVKGKLNATERGTGRTGPKPEAVFSHARLPIGMLAGDWRKTFHEWDAAAKAGHRAPVPPVFIIVCRDTKLAKVVYDGIARPEPGTAPLVPEFVNAEGKEVTVRVDSKVAEEMAAGAKSVEARRLREILNTVGLTRWRGGTPTEEWRTLAEELGLDPNVPPGRDVRCIVSVGMLTEGWDATTVTHVIGIRPFQSQLLCEQVVGRALRRSQWNDLKVEEVAQILGVPFEVVPFKATKTKESGPAPERNHVYARKDREDFAITFPRVERFVPVVKGRIAAAWERIPPLVLDPMQVPSEVVLGSLSIDEEGKPTMSGVGGRKVLSLVEARRILRPQEVKFRLAQRLTSTLHESLGMPAHRFFAEVLPIVDRYFASRVTAKGGFEKVDVALYEPWFEQALNNLADGIGGADDSGAPEEVPRYDPGRPEGSTFDVDTWTSRKVHETLKSHLNFAVADTDRWEQAAAYYLDRSDFVVAYAKNYDMGFTIPYVSKGERHEYHPDYLARMRFEGREVGTLILEVKGYMDEAAMLKAHAARRWVDAVNRHGKHGRWDYTIAHDPATIESRLRVCAQSLAERTPLRQVTSLAEFEGAA